MTLVSERVQDAPTGVRVADSPGHLSALFHPACAAVVWRRQPIAPFQDWIDSLSPDQLPKARMILRPSDVRSAITTICATSGTPDCTERIRLIDDVAALADIFAELSRTPHLRLRLDVVTTNACRKFHIDSVTSRLICTYRGTGTQYGNLADTDQPRRIFTVPTGAPIVMRGTLWPEHPRSGLMHRSPPIEGTGETRLVLVLDPVGCSDVPSHPRSH